MKFYLLKIIIESFKEALLPTRCRLCKAFYKSYDASHGPMNTSFEALMGPFLCSSCAEKAVPVTSPLCPMCGTPYNTAVGENHFCGDCIVRPKKFTKSRSVGMYDQSLMGVLHCLKYKGQTELARPLARWLFEAFLSHWAPDETDLIIPVPLHPRRLRMRGFNQSFLLVQPWLTWLAKFPDQSHPISVSRDVLLRHRDTSPQTRLGRTHRFKNVQRAFSVNNRHTVERLRILLIDDVYTTGATANACAEVLLNAGAKKIDVLTVARTKN